MRLGVANRASAAPSGPLVIINPKATHYSMDLVDLARAVEERGLGGIYLCEHTHIPVSHPRSESPSTGGEISRWVKCLWDPYIALAFAAAVSDLEIGTSVGLPAEHDPIVFAKQLATLDELSGGRLVLGVGWGWHREEFEHHGYQAADRVAVLRDKLSAMRAIWVQEEASHEGPFVNFAPSWSWPKPRQQGGPPILLGVPANRRNFERIVGWADGWIPMALPLRGPDVSELAGHLAELRGMWQDGGRSGELQVAVMHPAEPSSELRQAIDCAAEVGVQRLIFQVDDLPTAETLDALDAVAKAFASR
jgi:probable F420-dependent oxidoreductase